MFFLIENIITVIIVVILFALIRRVRRRAKENIFSYRIVTLLGLTIFVVGMIVTQLMELIINIPYPESYMFRGFYYGVVSDFSFFTELAFLLVVPFSLFLVISSACLIMREGKSLVNILGLLLGVALFAGSILASSTYDLMSGVMDANYRIGFHIYLIAENFISIALCYLECMMMATMYVAFRVERHKPNYNMDYLIILGCRVREDGQPGGMLCARIDAAEQFAKAQKAAGANMPTIIASGGQGSDEIISEAECMRRCLKKRKYNGKIVLEDQSKTTRQNFLFSKKLIEPNSKVAFVTTDFHVFRSGVIASKNGLHHIECISAKSPWYYYANYLIREFVANLNSERKFHLSNLLFLNLLSLTLIIISLIFDIL